MALPPQAYIEAYCTTPSSSPERQAEETRSHYGTPFRIQVESARRKGRAHVGSEAIVICDFSHLLKCAERGSA